MKVLILGAAGQVADLLRDNLLKETNDSLVLYARNAHERLTVKDDAREEIVEGDFLDEEALKEALTGVDAVYLNDMGNTEAVKAVIKAMKASQVKRFIGATILGIYNEVGGAFGEWNHAMIGTSPRMQAQKDSAEAVENADLDYTDRKSTRLNSSHVAISYAVFCLKKKTAKRKISPMIGPAMSNRPRTRANRPRGRWAVNSGPRADVAQSG